MLSPERFAALIDVMPYGVALLADGRYVYVNQAWAEQLGRPASGHTGRKMLDDIHDGDRPLMASWLASQRFDQRKDGEFRFLKANGDTIALEVTPLPPRQFGVVVSHAFVSRDITNLRKLQARILVADRAMSVGALAAGVAHEVNNPLSAVAGNIAFAAEQLDGIVKDPSSEITQEVGEALAEARTEVDRAAKIVKDLHLFASPMERGVGPVSVEEAIESAIAMAYPQIRQRAKLVRDFQHVPPVNVRASKLAQVVLNLLLNAAHALQDGQAAGNEIRVATHLDDKNRVVITLSDTGPGIPPERIGHVFDTFLTAQPIGIGSGLGLTIAHSIVKEMHGRITVDSVLGEGATFRVYLPAARDDDDEERTPVFNAPEPTGDSKPARILIVDDEPFVGTALGRALKEHAVRISKSGTEAIELLEDPNVEPDLIFCDLIMPDRTGVDVYRWVKEHRPDLTSRIVFMTGGPVDARMHEFLAQVDNYQIEKPFDVNGVRNFVRLQMRAKKIDDDDEE